MLYYQWLWFLSWYCQQLAQAKKLLLLQKLIKQTTKNEGIYAQLPSTKTKEEAQKVLDPIAKKYQGIKGIKHSIDYQEDKFIEDLEVDYTNIDYEKAKEVLGKNFQDPAKTKISMKKTEELMNKMGYTEQK